MIGFPVYGFVDSPSTLRQMRADIAALEKKGFTLNMIGAYAQGCIRGKRIMLEFSSTSFLPSANLCVPSRILCINNPQEHTRFASRYATHMVAGEKDARAFWNATFDDLMRLPRVRMH